MPVKGPIPQHRRAHRIGGWLPRDPEIIRGYVNSIVEHMDITEDLTPEVDELAKLIYSNTTVRMLFTAMLTEVPEKYKEDPSLQPEIRDVKTLLAAINGQVQHPIKYNDSVQIGTPINAILNWPMATESGFTAFLRDDVNACFQKILGAWGAYLTDPDKDSISTVNIADGGWLSSEAQNDPNNPGLKNFLKIYDVPDPDDIHYGFKTWDEFFTRKFLPDLRPVASPTHSRVITSAAESTPFALQFGVQLRDSFWGKDQHYSLEDMLGDRKMAEAFVGGTVYQAFLSADSYHNWHAPVSGRFMDKPSILDGTYYSEPVIWGFSNPNPDAGSDARSQGYISCIAKRGVVYIQPDDESLGIIAIVMIGMAEVSSIEFNSALYENGFEHFNKGDEIGRFHFGGSTHCLVFGPGVKFLPEPVAIPQDPTHGSLDQPPVPVCSALGMLLPSGK
ncbi:hypothetical protein MMC10_008975 [Thelotrema lepadinum]|nr:hypothetical protein [Thelotrema lepadinum]